MRCARTAQKQITGGAFGVSALAFSELKTFLVPVFSVRVVTRHRRKRKAMSLAEEIPSPRRSTGRLVGRSICPSLRARRAGSSRWVELVDVRKAGEGGRALFR